MPKQNPFGKIGEDSPPETPTKKGNEPEPERTLLIKHDVCVYRIPPQVTISSRHGIQHRHHHDVMNMNWIFGLRTALTHEGRTAVCFRKNSTPSIVIILCLPACCSSQLSSLSSYFSLQSQPSTLDQSSGMEGNRLESGKSRLERENENGGSLVTKRIVHNSFLSRWVWDQEQRSSWKRRRQTGRSTQSVRLRPILV